MGRLSPKTSLNKHKIVDFGRFCPKSSPVFQNIYYKVSCIARRIQPLGYCPTNRLQMAEVLVYNSQWGYIWNLWILLALLPVFLQNHLKKLKYVFPGGDIRKILILLVFLPVFLQSVAINSRNRSSKTVFVCVLFFKTSKTLKISKLHPRH